jgi:hypothetical protein
MGSNYFAINFATHFQFTIIKQLRSTTEQMPALVHCFVDSLSDTRVALGQRWQTNAAFILSGELGPDLKPCVPCLHKQGFYVACVQPK